MDFVRFKLNRSIRKTNSFQIILVSISVHCFVSISMIYTHLCWYFDNDIRKFDPLSIASKKGGIFFLKQDELNLVSNDILEDDQIAIRGWWKDHNKYDVNVVCFQHKGIACDKVLSSECKSDSIRAIYQYIPLRNNIRVKDIDVSLKANTEHLQESISEPSFGLYLMITLDNGLIENLKIEFPSAVEEWTKRFFTYSAPRNSYISKLTLMLICFGYSGTVYFTDITIVPHEETSHLRALDMVDYCGNASFPDLPMDENKYVLDYMSLSGGSVEHSKNILTLVTQVSMDRMSILEKTLLTWSGPVSLAVYVPVKNIDSGLLEWQKLYLNKKLKSLKLSSGSNVVVVMGVEGETDYPINKMRNAAMKQVKTKYSLLLDADFQPSPDLKKQFLSTVAKMNDTKKVAFVLPAFEYLENPKKDDGIPKAKEELLQLIMRDDPLIQPFRITESVESHKLTNYWRWYVTSKSYEVYGFSDKYEPYLIIENKRHLPLFDEQFTGYGMNKVTHTTELFAAKYKFLVLPNAWIIHLPHKSSAYSQDFLQNPQQKFRNRYQRFQFIHGLIQKYKIKQRLCSDSRDRS